MTLDEARELLGLDLQATRKEIRAAYRRAARRWHPDRAPSRQEEAYREKMQQINLAYQRLGQFLQKNRFAPGGKTGPGEGPREELKYRLSLGIWEDVARVHLRLTQVEPGRYRAEFAGAAQGAWRLLSRWLPESYETEMALEAGGPKPLNYREKFQAQGQNIN